MLQLARVKKGIVVLAFAVAGCATGHARRGTEPASPARAASGVEAGGDPSGVELAAQGPAETAGLGGLEHAFERAAAVIDPSVVSITSERPLEEDIPAFLLPFAPPDGNVEGMGSGIVIDARGYILTNNHVVEGARKLVVRLHDDRELPAEVVGVDPATDLAVVRIRASALEPAELADSDGVRVGQWVMAVGSPFGLPRSVTVGIVSAIGRGSMGIADYGDFIQTDAAVNQGNSGGPLIDLQGRVIGINTAIASRTGGSNGIGFAIPSNMARIVATQLIEHGQVERGWLGIVMGELTADLAASFGYEGRRGILIDDLDPAGPAARAGLRVGDIITQIDGYEVRDMAFLRNQVAQRRPGTKVRLNVFRDGKHERVDVSLGTLPGEKARVRPIPAGPEAKRPVTLGLRMEDPSAKIRGELGLAEGTGAVIVNVDRDSLAAAAELRPGDVLVSVDGKAVRSAAQARRMLEKADLHKGVRLRVKRGPYGRFVVLRHPAE